MIISLLSIGLLINLLAFLFLSGLIKTPSLATGFLPSTTIIGLEALTLSPSTPTPFQPLPTDTPTPTATLTPTPIPTNTLQPSNTPYPTNTRIPATQPPSDGIPSSAQVSGITGLNQSHLLSCESRSAVDWARYFGVSISENSFQAQLPLSDNPDTGFVGSPDGAEGQIPPNSYGVHADPVASLLRQYGLSATAVHGFSYDDLRKQIAAGHPVIVWVYGNVWYGGYPQSYTSSDGHTTTVIRYEHTVIVTGYDNDYVSILDGGMFYYRTTAQFLSSWSSLGEMAVIFQ
ncbi:MAG: C39 family peptidase [Anaerolineaceae bacterium]